MMIIGKTISFAGKPRMNASSITPSSPIKRPSGSRNDESSAIRLCPPTLTFAQTHSSAPAGAATAAALPRTKSVLSKTELMMTLPICGLR